MVDRKNAKCTFTFYCSKSLINIRSIYCEIKCSECIKFVTVGCMAKCIKFMISKSMTMMKPLCSRLLATHVATHFTCISVVAT